MLEVAAPLMAGHHLAIVVRTRTGRQAKYWPGFSLAPGGSTRELCRTLPLHQKSETADAMIATGSERRSMSEADYASLVTAPHNRLPAT
jgi:hypothetical protein